LPEVRRAAIGAVGNAVRFLDRRSRSVEAVNRILVCAIGGIGNTLLLAPLLRVLRESRPGGRVDLLLTNRAAVSLADEFGLADEVLFVPEEEWHRGLHGVRIFATLRRRQYDAVLRTFLTAADVSRASLGVYASGARIRIAYGSREGCPLESHVLQLDLRLPEVERHLPLARALGMTIPVRFEPLRAPERGRRWAEEFARSHGFDDRPLLGLHPGSDPVWMAKRWPAERFGALARLAGERFGMRPVVFGGPSDREAVARAMAAADGSALQATGQDIVQTAALIERCRAFVSNDSGLMHLASALDVPTLAIFGPTDPVKNRPLGPRTRILRLGLECSPCDLETATRRCAHRDCLNKLDVLQVLRALQTLLGESPQDPTSRREPISRPMELGAP